MAAWPAGEQSWTVEFDKSSPCTCEDGRDKDENTRSCGLFGGVRGLEAIVLMANLRCPPIVASQPSSGVLSNMTLIATDRGKMAVKKQWFSVVPCDVHAQPLFASMPTIDLLPAILEKEFEERVRERRRGYRERVKRLDASKVVAPLERKTGMGAVSRSMYNQMWKTSPISLATSTMHLATHYKRVGWQANLLSWADFHFALGFDALIIYAQDEVLDPYLELFSRRPNQLVVIINFHLHNFPPTEKRASVRGQV